MIVLTDPTEVIAALEEPALVPHPSADPSTGPTMRLRAAMARFSGPDDHADRRHAVVDAVSRANEVRLRSVAHERTTRRLEVDRFEVELLDVVGTVANVVPTEALATILGLVDPLDEIVADVEAVVRVIGRGEPASVEADVSTERLLERCGRLPAGAVPAVSLLYQNFDATAALIGTTLLAAATNRAAAAVPRTRRVALLDAVVGRFEVRAGTEVVLELASAGLPFGAGPHHCPGQRLAEAIVGGVVAAISDAGYDVQASGVTTDDDGRPTYLPCRHSG